jgi:PAS domain S-box-containing protein
MTNNSSAGNDTKKENESLRTELAELRDKVRELEETLDAIRSGEVDAIVVTTGEGRKVFTLEGADYPYRALVENIREGALTLSRTGSILYTNSRFADMTKLSADKVVGHPLLDFVCMEYHPQMELALKEILNQPCRSQVRIHQGKGSLPVYISMNPLTADEDTKISVVVTDRRKDEEQLQMQARMLNAVGDAVIAADTHNKIIYWNDAATKTYGWEPDEALGRDLVEVVTPEISHKEAQKIAARLRKGDTWTREYIVRHRDGHEFPIHASDAPVFDDEGKLIAIIGMSHDISERKRTEEALHKSEEKFRILFTQMAEGSALHEIVYNASGDPVDYRILDINPAFERILGLKREDVIGKTSKEVYGVDTPPYFEIYSRVAGTGQPEEFEVFFAPMKKHFAISVYSPEPKKIATIFVDITERMNAEETVRHLYDEVLRERDRLSSLINSISDEVWFADTHKNFTLANPAALKEFALGYGEIDIEKFATSLEVYHPDGTPRSVEEAPPLRALKGEEVRDLEEMIRTPGTGEMRYRQVSSNPVRDASGNIIGSVSVVKDTTARRKTEEELKQKHEDLNAAYEEITATQEELRQNIEELITREGQLKDALAEKEILLSEIHHRVKNNLAAFISLLSLEGSCVETPEGQALKKDLQNRARTMALIHETLYKTRQYSEVNMELYLSTLIDQVVNSYSSTQSIGTFVDAKGITLDLGSATPIGLIINELVTNSLKYAFPPDSIHCRADREEPCTIGIRLTKEDGTYLLIVSDNGVGLPKEFNIRITKSLGLKLVNFIARHQLRADLEIRTKNGTEFVFRFKERDRG